MNDEVISCPLCKQRNAITIKRFNLNDLIELWSSSYGFNPFPKNFPSTKIEKKLCISCKLHFYNPSYFGDAAFYAKISKHSWYYEENKWEYDIASKIIADNFPESLLEIGCGNGFFLEKFISSKCFFEGIDINKDAVIICQEKGLSVDDTDLYKINKSYEMVVLFEVLEHMKQPDKLIDFLVNKLVKPYGYILIAVPNPESYLQEIDNNLLDMPPHHNTCWPFATFEFISNQYGLEIIAYEKEPLRYLHYLSLLRNTVSEYSKYSPKTLHFYIFKKMQSLIVRLLSPLSFYQDRGRIDGQTHLLVLKKTH